MKRKAYYIINGITLYRLLMAPVLILLIFIHDEIHVFKWLLGISFFTDLIDGWLARRYQVTSKWGARLDSYADDLTVVAGLIGMVVLKPEFLKQHLTLVLILLALFILQTVLALIRYGKLSSFHTYSAKFAALMQGSFLILLFFLPQPPVILFYIAFVATAIDLIEEIILIMILPEWKADVKGLYWIVKEKRRVG